MPCATKIIVLANGSTGKHGLELSDLTHTAGVGWISLCRRVDCQQDSWDCKQMTTQVASALLVAYAVGGGITLWACAESKGLIDPSPPDSAYFTFVALWPITVPIFFLRLLWIGSVYLVKHI